MAKTIFNSWFMDFAPVQRKQKGVLPVSDEINDLFPDELVDSKDLERFLLGGMVS